MAPKTYLRVISFNVRLIKSRARRTSVLDYIKNMSADVYCLQECGISVPVGEHEWVEGEHIWSGSTCNKNDGVGILLGSKDLKMDVDRQEKLRVLEAIKLHTPRRIQTIMLGDFNCTTEGENFDVSGKRFKEIISDIFFLDATEMHLGKPPPPTFKSDSRNF